MINVAVCDDEKPFLEMMKRYIDRYFKLRNIDCLIECFESGKALISEGSGLSGFDIVFLDINMEDVDGIDAAKEIRKYSSAVFIVFVTAYIRYSLEGYKVDAIRYILKNNIETMEESLNECLDTIIEKMNYTVSMKHFVFNECEKDINIDHITYIESSLHKLKVHVMENPDGVYSMYEKLDNMEQELSEYRFVRVHQSYLVNLKHIVELREHSEKMQGARTVLVSTGEELIVPKARFKAVKKAYVAYLGEF